MSNDVKYMLKESYASTKSITGLSPTSPTDFKRILGSNKAFNAYVESLSENMKPEVKKEFKILAESTRIKLLENSTYALQPYETLTMPVLSVFYPRLIARELVTVAPIDKPDVIKAFLQPVFTKWNDKNAYPAPSYNNVSSGPNTSNKTIFPNGASVQTPSQTNLLQLFNLNSETSHIERDLLLYSASDGNGNTVDITESPDVDGNIAFSVSIGGATDTITGTIDYYTGMLTLNSASGIVKALGFSVSTSLEENTINPYTQLVLNKIRLQVKDREISAQWTVQYEQDIKALYDIDLQAEFVTVMGQQVQMDIDREIVGTLFAIGNNTNMVGDSHRQSFSYAAPSDFYLGPKIWYENIIPKLTLASQVIYTDTNIQAANIIACNPIDASILESLNGFVYNGSAQDGGEFGYGTASLQGGKWKVLTTPIVPQGQMLLTYKPDVEIKSVFLYSPYVPAVLMPYPLQNKPAMTILSRYATSVVRPNGISILSLTNFNQAYGQGTVTGFNGTPGANPTNAWL